MLKYLIFILTLALLLSSLIYFDYKLSIKQDNISKENSSVTNTV